MLHLRGCDTPRHPCTLTNMAPWTARPWTLFHCPGFSRALDHRALLRLQTAGLGALPVSPLFGCCWEQPSPPRRAHTQHYYTTAPCPAAYRDHTDHLSAPLHCVVAALARNRRACSLDAGHCLS